MKRIIKRNKNKISRAFRVHAYWREKLKTSKGKRKYFHNLVGEYQGEIVWVSSK